MEEHQLPSLESISMDSRGEEIGDGVFHDGDIVWKFINDKDVALREFTVGYFLSNQSKNKWAFATTLDLTVETRYWLKQKYVVGKTLAEWIEDGPYIKGTGTFQLKAATILRDILFLLEENQHVFTHYDLSICNILVTDKQEIRLIDFEYSYCSEVKCCPETQACNAVMESLIQGTVSPGIYDPYIDVIVLLTTFFASWKGNYPTDGHFATFEEKCMKYFQSIGLYITGDPRIFRKDRYLTSSVEYNLLINKISVLKGKPSLMDTIPIFNADRLKPISFETLCKELDDPRWDMSDHVYTLKERIDFCSLFIQYKKYNLKKLKVSGEIFRKTILSYLEDIILILSREEQGPSDG